MHYWPEKYRKRETDNCNSISRKDRVQVKNKRMGFKILDPRYEIDPLKSDI